MLNRIQAPEIHSISSIDFIPPKITVLENKARLIYMQNQSSETVQITFCFNAGAIQAKPIIAKICCDLLFSGTQSKTGSQIEEELDFYGAYKSASVTKEEMFVSIFGLKENINEILEIAIDAISNVSFKKEEINEKIITGINQLEINLKKVNFLARRHFLKSLYPDNIYGESIEIKDFDNVQRSSLIEFYKQHILSGLKYVTVTGNFTEKELYTIENFSSKFKTDLSPLPRFPISKINNQHDIPIKDSVQSALRIGKRLFNKTHSDYIGFTVLNTILGGYFGSRLMTSIREDKGYTYGINTAIAQFKNDGYFFITTEVNNVYKDATIEAIKKEITLLQTVLVEEEELNTVRNYMVGSLLDQSDGISSKLDMFLAVDDYGLNLDFYNKMIQEIRSISPIEIQKLAQKYLSWEDFTIVTVG